MRPASQAMLRADFPQVHPHNRHRHLLLPDFFVVSLQHKSGARPMASTLLMLERRAELWSEAMPRFRPFPSYVISTNKLRASVRRQMKPCAWIQGSHRQVQTEVITTTHLYSLRSHLINSKQAGWLKSHL